MTKSTGKIGYSPRIMTPRERLDFYTIPEALTGCHLCWAAPNKAGYPTIAVNRKRYRANRLAWELANGPIPAGQIVCHRCDNPGCANPDHLFIGTHADNMADKVSKQRQSRGEGRPMAKLTEADAREIYFSSLGVTRLARRYGVHRDTVYSIKNGHGWRHIHDAHPA